MACLAMLTSLFVCSIVIINLSMNTLQLTKCNKPLSTNEIHLNMIAHKTHVQTIFSKWRQTSSGPLVQICPSSSFSL